MVGARMNRAMAARSGKDSFEYLYAHAATFSLYNILTVPLWKALPWVSLLVDVLYAYICCV